jgi:hypothetical protein
MKLRTNHTPGCSGTLCQRTKKKKLKNGKIQEYPIVVGERDRNNIFHWFWHLSFKLKQTDGSFKSSTVSVRAEQVEAIQNFITNNIQLETILRYLQSSK